MNKLLFLASFEGDAERKYNRYKKARKILSHIMFPLLGVSFLLMPIGFFLGLPNLAGIAGLIFTYGSMAWAPTFYVLSDVMRWDINHLTGIPRLTYKQFKKMEKSGELDFYKMLLEDLRKQEKAGRKDLAYHPAYDDSFYEKYINGQAELKYDDENMIIVKTAEKVKALKTVKFDEEAKNQTIKTKEVTKAISTAVEEDNDLTI